MDGSRTRSFRIWLLPLSILLAVAGVLFFVPFLVDSGGDLSKLHLLLEPNASAAETVVTNSADVIAGVLGIAITVVAIIVELAANRYTHRIAELFVHEPVNFVVMGYFVVAALQGFVVGLVFDASGQGSSGFVPYVGVAVSNTMLAVGLLILLPYFAFVFDFLNPIHIVDRMRRHTLDVIARQKGTNAEIQAEAVRGIEQLADVGLNAMEHKDKGVSMASVDALQQMVLDYQAVCRRLPDEWFRVEGELAHNPDFVSMSDSVHEAVTRRRIWLEMKILRKYQTLYNEALNKMRDINYVVAINTRHIATAALESKHVELFELAVKFFNTYMRSTVNARDVRTAYNVLYQYRLVAEAALAEDGGRRAAEIARYFKYYGLVAFNANLPFILETVAYDLCSLCELAFDRRSPATRELLRIFLQVDKESESAAQEVSLRGVRKAQVKLATYYLLHGDEELARQVYRDMETERRERLASIRDELLGVTSSEFWEISDRGQNFDYLSPERKQKMLFFFSWFADLVSPTVSRMPEELVSSSIPLPAVPNEPLVEAPGLGRDPGTSEPPPGAVPEPTTEGTAESTEPVETRGRTDGPSA